MTRLKTAWRLAAAGAAVTLLLASCGGDDDGDGEEASNGGDTSGGEDVCEMDTTPAEAVEPAPNAKGDGTLTFGSLLPSTGDLAFLGPPEFAGVDLAIEEINAAGGVLGSDVEDVDADSGDGSPNIAPSETNKLLNAGSDVVVGAASSSVSLSVIDRITGAGVVHFSPANTSTEFDTYDDKGMYFRTSPSDVLQGAVMANLVASDGHDNVAILARQDSYGEALANQVDEVFRSAGGNVVAKEFYNAEATNFNAEVNKVTAEDPQALVLIAFNETTKIIPDLIEAGYGPQDIQVYFVDGNTADYSADFEPGTLEGIRATFPGAELTSDFEERLLCADPELKDFTYGPESYDATIMSALAALAAGDDDGRAIASQLVQVSKDGTECSGFKECADLIAAGEDIDYQGVSGPVELGDTGSPTQATIGIFEYLNDNTFENVDYQEGQI